MQKTESSPRRTPRILICTPEITELPEGMGNAANLIRAKGGGMGDISAGLIRYLHSGHRYELHVALPKYDNKIRDLSRLSARQMDLLVPVLHRQGIHLVVDSAFSHLAEVYGDTEEHPAKQRAEAFQRHIINHLLDEVQPDVVHCNDWMTGLIPAAARERGIKSLFTLHNIFTERDTLQNIDRSGIDVRRMIEHLYFEWFPHENRDTWTRNRVDFTATGILAADVVNTVSESFLGEIIDGTWDALIPESIRNALRDKHRRGRALGILNAPADTVDPSLMRSGTAYGPKDVIDKKLVNKADFQRRMGLEVLPDAPLFFWPSRLYGQKGPELLLEVATTVTRELGGQIALVANGDPKTVRAFQLLGSRTSGRVAHRYFAEDLSELGKAGSDFILMPSLYEPCGLPQMEGPRFGTLPVARLTGGLRDTVTELDVTAQMGNGFAFEEYSASALEGAMRRAVEFFRLPRARRKRTLVRIMGESFEQFSLARTAEKYTKVYDRLIAERLAERSAAVVEAAETS